MPKGIGYKKRTLEGAMREVHNNVPSSVRASGKTGKAKERMLRAIAFSKARKRTSVGNRITRE